ncbi:hypothetical protein [Candidatus Solirubrobacter pratensis]|uniref:hypothetical protein n=1 Tax=Candidatus Solirubrobacter pratensis TaxID=1298857 RepID=UPI000404B02C|nr:hypothetical protein [Candidatus Solirubrobacter pratensis]
MAAAATTTPVYIWARALADLAELRQEQRDPLLAALVDSHYMRFTAEPLGGELRWHAEWCLPPLAEMDAAVVAVLEQRGLGGSSPSSDARVSAASTSSGS